MITRVILIVVLAIILSIITGGCNISPSGSGPDKLDLAIRDTSNYLNDNIFKESMIVIPNMQLDSIVLSNYTI